jgi:hypothetical protein
VSSSSGEIGDDEKSDLAGAMRALLFPDRLAGAVRPRDDRIDGLRHTGHRLGVRIGAGDRRRWQARGSSCTRRMKPSRRWRHIDAVGPRVPCDPSSSGAFRRPRWLQRYLDVYARVLAQAARAGSPSCRVIPRCGHIRVLR